MTGTGRTTYQKSEILESENFNFQPYFAITEQMGEGDNFVDYCITIQPKTCSNVKPCVLRSVRMKPAKSISEIDMNGEFPAKIDIGSDFSAWVHIKHEENGDFDVGIELESDCDDNLASLEVGYLFTEDDMRKFIESGKWLCDNDSDSLRK